ncbi:hypothetical protein MKS88_000381 [Plasmodium brasilianum]|uniref:Uncharacterized protein n=1 Tax=Plasmodium brasilianum TaxID=5824 RepID=A0ACB9YGK6_PLABR|nr:hypothetical protein MKS88_000381 [Plasmodium brasilianum]
MRKNNYVKEVRKAANADFKYLRKCIQRKGDIFFALVIFHVIVGVAGAALYVILKKLTVTDAFLFKALAPLFILWLIVLVWLFRIERKTAKYEKLIHIKSDLHNTAYPFVGKVVHYKN